MPRIATAASADEEASSSRVDDLIQRGRSQGHLSLSDLRTAFEQAGLTPAEARSILRELSEAGVRLADEETELKAPRSRAKPPRRAARRPAAKAARPAATETAAKKTRAKKADQPAAAAGSAGCEPPPPGAPPGRPPPGQADGDGDPDFDGDEIATLKMPPVEGLVASLDNDAQAGAQGDQDPVYGGSLGTFAAMSTIWAWTENGEANPLVSDFYWMYDDGPSWVHRNAILDAACTDANGSYCVAGAGSASTNDGSCTGACAGLSVGELFISAAGTPPPLVFTMAQASATSTACVDRPERSDAGLPPGCVGRRHLRSR